MNGHGTRWWQFGNAVPELHCLILYASELSESMELISILSPKCESLFQFSFTSVSLCTFFV